MKIKINKMMFLTWSVQENENPIIKWDTLGLLYPMHLSQYFMLAIALILGVHLMNYAFIKDDSIIFLKRFLGEYVYNKYMDFAIWDAKHSKSILTILVILLAIPGIVSVDIHNDFLVMANAIIEETTGDNKTEQQEAVLNFINSGKTLSICTLALLYCNILQYISLTTTKNVLLPILKKILSEKNIDRYKTFSTWGTNYNKTWVILLWGLLIVSLLSSLYFSMYLLEDIELILDILKNNKN